MHALAQWLLLRADVYVCNECSGPVYFWNRRVWLVKDKSCVHVSCWQSQLFFHQHLQATAAAMREFEVSQNPEPLREDVRAMASELRVAILRLEQVVWGSDFSDARPRMKEVFALAQALDDLLRQWSDYT